MAPAILRWLVALGSAATVMAGLPKPGPEQSGLGLTAALALDDACAPGADGTCASNALQVHSHSAGKVGAVAGVAAAAAVSGEGTAHSEQIPLQFIEHDPNDDSRLIDQPPKGLSCGDMWTWNNTLFDETEKCEVGMNRGVSILTELPGTWMITMTYWLPGGQITVQGPQVDGQTTQMSVTGGTGIYMRAEGELTYRQLPRDPKQPPSDPSKKWEHTFLLYLI